MDIYKQIRKCPVCKDFDDTKKCNMCYKGECDEELDFHVGAYYIENDSELGSICPECKWPFEGNGGFVCNCNKKEVK